MPAAATTATTAVHGAAAATILNLHRLPLIRGLRQNARRGARRRGGRRHRQGKAEQRAGKDCGGFEQHARSPFSRMNRPRLMVQV